jgi:hypothetical protein
LKVSLAETTVVAMEQRFALEAVILKPCGVIAALLLNSPMSVTAPQRDNHDTLLMVARMHCSPTVSEDFRVSVSWILCLGVRFDGRKI